MMDFANKIKTLRKEKRLSLDELAMRCDVSKSMISKIERNEKMPTLLVAAKIAEGLGTTLSSLLAEPREANVVVTRKKDRSVFCDEVTGFRRMLLSPQTQTASLEFIENSIPERASSPAFPPHRLGVAEYITVRQGTLEVCLDEKTIVLEEDDSLFFQAHVTHQFKNAGRGECRYYLVIDSRNKE